MKPTFSFSRLSSHDTCPLMWEYNYVDELKGLTNFYAQYGTFAHLIFELYAKGKIEDPLYVWDKFYNKRVFQTSPDIPKWEEKWFNEGREFFARFEWFGGDTVWTEEHVMIDFDSFLFQGFVDRLESRGKDLVIVDFKSSKPFTASEIETKGRQMYLYSRAVKDKLGKYPNKLEFLHFRQNKSTVIDFSLKEYNTAVDWAKGKVKEIMSAEEFPPKPNFFFCNNICNFREICTQKG